MSDVVLRVKGLSKSFRTGHRLSYHRFSELLENLGRNLSRLPGRLLNRRGQKTSSSPETFWAVDDVSFEIKRGEVVGFIGRNGAGKSTLLKLLTRITFPTRGRFEVRGRIGSLLEVGTGFHPELTGRENIFLNGAVLGMSRAEILKKFDEIVAFSEVERFLDTPVKRYSSGMYVRLAFAVAANLEPEIMIVDEVLAVGDSAFQQKCMAKMSDASRQGRTVLFVTHSLPVITNLCHRAILLERGRITAMGAPTDVVRQYLSNTRSTSGEVVWSDPASAPGSEMVRLHSVRVFQAGMEGSSSDIDMRKDISIQISYWNLTSGQQLYSALRLKDSNGIFILATSNAKSVSATDDPWYGVPQPAGLYQATCVVPGNLLNAGHYVISAIIGRVPNRTIVNEESVLSFDVRESGVSREDHFRSSARPVLRPALRWVTIPEIQS